MNFSVSDLGFWVFISISFNTHYKVMAFKFLSLAQTVSTPVFNS